ncbi:MAG: helix-turn-helix transcriptional regulator [Acidaminococcus intestini]|uniref:Helix-turn-helix transcriptional regulator n=1 Tax=Acidaminococcus intestini TaxID=187327 RepID=A0A943EI72_9FIRM|nr:helix-turn-helix transcriptional regulator [Acidaminococcus intestini]
MNNLGKRLKERREQLKYSLKEVSVKTGITDSRLCRIENGQYPCQAGDLKQLGILYNLPVISLFLDAGFLDKKDIEIYQHVFSDVSELDDEEREQIQWLISHLAKKKGTGK